MSFNSWKTTRLSKPLDIDHAFGDQCVDVAMDYSQWLFNKPWQQILGYGNAKDLFNTSSPSFFTKIVNNHGDPNQLPKQGDIAIFGATPTNPYGHLGIVDAASPRGIDLIQQDGFNPKGVVFEKFRPWSASPCIGWLRPKTSPVAKVIQKVQPKPAAKAVFYTVHSGDTLTAIAKRFNTTVAKLVKLNGIKNPDLIKVGQHLQVS